jgi:very-short-patch-repair endonuclease
MRRAPAATEDRLWTRLRNRGLEELKFRRQVPIGRFVVDFVCARHRLIVEADGPFHDPEKDAQRDAWLAEQGYRVVRFSNADIAGSIDAVLDRIRGLTTVPLIPSPLAGEGVSEADG